ncbi:MAG: hypothetical protein ACO3EZ_17455 [Prochlorotrichaceae cyanobacterium]
MAMDRNSRGMSLFGGVVLAICGLWLGLMLSNRDVVLPFFFLGRQTIALPIVFWLFGAFVLGNAVSLALLSFLQFTIDRLIQAEVQERPSFARSAARSRPFPPEWEAKTTSAASEDPALDWEDEDLDWQDEPPSPQPVAPSNPDRTAFARESSDPPAPIPPDLEDEADAWDDPEWQAPSPPEPSSQEPSPKNEVPPSPSPTPPPTSKVYEAPNPPPQGSQSGSSYSYRYRPSRRSQEPVDRSPPPQPRRKSQPGIPQKVVDVNYRVINPGSQSSPTPSRSSAKPDRDQGWDESANPEDW